MVEDMARAMWDTQRSSDPAGEYRLWERAGAYWQIVMRQFAEATLRAISLED
jgi:hypothetical protein